MAETSEHKFAQHTRERSSKTAVQAKYDRRSLTYSNTFANPVLRGVIAIMELLTGKLTILRWIRNFEKLGPPSADGFFRQVLDVMGIPLRTPQDQLNNIPKTGPVVVVANHPHGMVDGMVLADLVGQVRSDYRVLTRSVLVDLDEAAAKYMIPVPFPHDPDALAKGIEMRAAAMKHLSAGGVIAVFPSGVVASSDTFFGPAVERDWNVFTAKLIQRSGATVVPVRFHGQNSRWYHIANKISATLRQGLLVHEIANQKNTPQAPTVGARLSADECATWKGDPRGFMTYLRNLTMSLPSNVSDDAGV
ncbi:MAG: lysophospholipid acyltransferase family protein [Planktomarina sp.]